jgi:hypothetical protein
MFKVLRERIEWCLHNCHAAVLLLQFVVVVCLLAAGWFVRQAAQGRLQPYWVEPILGMIGIALGLVLALSVHRWRMMREPGQRD